MCQGSRLPSGFGMRDDGGNDRAPVVGMQFVATAFDADKPPAGNSVGKGCAMLDRKDRIRCPVNDEQRNLDLAQASFQILAALQHEMVSRAQEAAGSIVVLLDERAHRLLVEGMRG